MEKVTDDKPASAAPEKSGTRVMGPPSAPIAHPENQRAAVRGPPRSDDDSQSPYVQLDEDPVEKHGTVESILDAFNSWANKAESLASNVWATLKTAPEEAAWGKGGIESLFRQTFPTTSAEKLKKTFACYLSTATGPVAGTLYASDVKVAFCSDRPLSFTAPSGQEAWIYYKLAVPLARVTPVIPVAMLEKYIEIVTVDAHEFWFMGLVNYDKAAAHLREAVAEFAQRRLPPPGQSQSQSQSQSQ